MEPHRGQSQADDSINVEISRLSPYALPFVPRAPSNARQLIRITTPSGVPIVLPPAVPQRPRSIPVEVKLKYDEILRKQKQRKAGMGSMSVEDVLKYDERLREKKQRRAEARKMRKELKEREARNASTGPVPAWSNSPNLGLGGSSQKPEEVLQSTSFRQPQVDEVQRTPSVSENDMSEENPAPENVLTTVETKQAADHTDELFLLPKLDEAERYFEPLPVDQRYKIVISVFLKALGGNDEDATLAGQLFVRAISMGKLTSEDVESGVAGAMECLSDDIAVDAPGAYTRAVKMLFLAKLDVTVATKLEYEIALCLVMSRERLFNRFERLTL